MSVSSIQETILLYTQEQNNLTSRLSTVMGSITSATRKTTELLTQTNSKRQYFAQMVEDGKISPDSTAYESQTEAIENDYQLQLAQINSWESELEQEKSGLETQLKAVTQYQESWQSALKENIKKDFTYGQGAGS